MVASASVVREWPDTVRLVVRDEVPPAGPMNGRQFSAPEGGPTTLLDMKPAKKPARKKADTSDSDGASV